MILKMATGSENSGIFTGFGGVIFIASIVLAAVLTTEDSPVYAWPLTYVGIGLLFNIFNFPISPPSGTDSIFSILVDFLLLSPIYFIQGIFNYLFGYDTTEGKLTKLRKEGISFPDYESPVRKSPGLNDYSSFYFAGSKSLSYDKEYVMTKGGKLTKPVLYSTIILILVAVIPLISISASPVNPETGNPVPINYITYWDDLLPTIIGFISAIIIFIYGTVKGAGSSS
jgi:hypothetical protein